MTSQNDLLDKGQESAEDEPQSITDPPVDTTPADTDPDAMNQVNRARDRIAQAYLGLWGGTAVQEKARRRLHWIAEQVQGRRVLDIGCSEGMLAILLAREGFEVTGIDVNPDALDYARELLENEHDFVRERVIFQLSDGIAADFEPGSFDTVILGEVIEHLTRPDQMIERAVGYLKPGGVLIITTPFGYFPDPDHRQTFMLTDMVRLLKTQCHPDHLTIFDGYIRFLGRNIEIQPKSWKAILEKTIIEETERSALEIHTRLFDDLKNQRELVNQLRQSLKEYQEKTKSELGHLNTRAHEFRDIYEKTKVEKEKLQIRFDDLKQQLLESRSKIDEQQLKVTELQVQIGNKNDRIGSITEELDHKNKHINTQKVELEQKERDLGSMARELEELYSKLSEKSEELSSVQNETAKKQQELEQIERDLGSMARELEGLYSKLSKKSEELSSVQAKLNAQSEILETKNKINEDNYRELAMLRIEQQKWLNQYATLQARYEDLRKKNSELAESAETGNGLVARLSEAYRQQHRDLVYAIQDRDRFNQSVSEYRILEYMSRIRVEAAENTLSYRLGHAIIKLFIKPGFRSASGFVQTAANIIALGYRKLKGGSDPVVLERSVMMPDGSAIQVQFTCELPDCLSEEENRVTYSIPGDKKIYLISKESSKLTERPKCPQIVLMPEEWIKISGVGRIHNGNPRLHIVEYTEQHVVQGFDSDIRNGTFEHFLFTNGSHKGLCLAIELQGKGSFELDEISFTCEERYPNPMPMDQLPAILENRNPISEPKEKLTPEGSNAGLHSSPLNKIRVACIMDEFTFSSYEPECDLKALSVTQWRDEIREFKPDFLFVESAWKGKDGAWSRKIDRGSDDLYGIINLCREKSIPTVFWNKEDPIHFKTFINTASLFDYVFTTDIDCIHKYKSILSKDNVFLLPFACQPSQHNPIEKYERENAFCFAGAYYVRYPDRQRDFDSIISAVSGLARIVIYDRNFGETDTNYMFPEAYRPYIVGKLPFDQIDKAYKGYRYAINLNSIKQSQTMFARRVFEVLASNTLTISNFSRGIRMLFGDLIFTSDNEGELKTRLESVVDNPVFYRKLRLAGLRKVMQEHTYQDRLNYVVSKVTRRPLLDLFPEVIIVGCPNDENELNWIVEAFDRQGYKGKSLTLILPAHLRDLAGGIPQAQQIVHADEFTPQHLVRQVKQPDFAFVAIFHANDYYGPNYITDLMIACKYCDAEAIGKAACYQHAEGCVVLQNDGAQYQITESLAIRSSAIHLKSAIQLDLDSILESIDRARYSDIKCLAIDEFNYCKDTGIDAAPIVDDIQDIYTGKNLDEYIQLAESVIAGLSGSVENQHAFSGKRIGSLLKEGQHGKVHLSVQGAFLQVKSSLTSEEHQYVYGPMIELKEFDWQDEARFHMDIVPGLNVQAALIFIDANGQKLGNYVGYASVNNTCRIPQDTSYIIFALRVMGQGSCYIKELLLDHIKSNTPCILGGSKTLFLSNLYPSYTDLYRNGFLHRRMKAYQEYGLRPDLFIFKSSHKLEFSEYDNVDVITGGDAELDVAFASNSYRNVCIHFLNQEIWERLKPQLGKIQLFIWLHGSEVQPWHRRKFNFSTRDEIDQAMAESEIRCAFWKSLFNQRHQNVNFVFVSNYLKSEVCEDYSMDPCYENFHVIHNYIDSEIFQYREKSPELRKKILSIRPYASRKYGNDLTVEAIHLLSTKSFFNDLEFRIVGDGHLFNSINRSLEKYSNVTLDKRFYSQSEIAGLHMEYGIFLNPTRWDSQGVSRDEAMSSGLVPITNNNTAIPEFVDDSCGMLVENESPMELAEAITKLYHDPDLFCRLSANAASRIRNQSNIQNTIEKELNLIK